MLASSWPFFSHLPPTFKCISRHLSSSFTITFLLTFKFFSFWPFALGALCFMIIKDYSFFQSCKLKLLNKQTPIFNSFHFPSVSYFLFFNMKLLSSSPSVSSSSTTSNISFDPKMCTPKSVTSGCLAGILRRILCSQSLPTHPSDHISESNTNSSVASYGKKQEFNAVDKTDDASSKVVAPGIVARLMGLDSLPDISQFETQVHPNSITRSLSMNSVDYKQQDIDSIQCKLRRVHSTLSFRDMPTSYFELENEEFLVLSFEKGSEKKELRTRGRKYKGGNGELKQRKGENKENKVAEKVLGEKDKEDDQAQAKSRRVLNVLSEEKLNRRIVANCNEVNGFCLEKPIVIIKGQECSKSVDKKAMPDGGAKLRKKKKKIQHHVAQIVEQPETACSSEDSSPISVLDFDQFIIDHDVPTSEEDSKAEGFNSRRKLSPELENYGCKSPSNDGNLTEDDPRVNTNTIEGKSLRSRIKDYCHSVKNLEYWDSICRMIEAEVDKSSWFCSKTEDMEDITADFGSKILDQLLDELVTQLHGISPMKNLNL